MEDKLDDNGNIVLIGEDGKYSKTWKFDGFVEGSGRQKAYFVKGKIRKIFCREEVKGNTVRFGPCPVA